VNITPARSLTRQVKTIIGQGRHPFVRRIKERGDCAPVNESLEERPEYIENTIAVTKSYNAELE
jgi:hypothetical protein